MEGKQLWFKRKWYGWGWYPASWQGWLVTVAYVGLIIALASSVDDGSTDKEVALMVLLPSLILTAAFIRVAYATGERPRWQWGRPRDEDGSSS